MAVPRGSAAKASGPFAFLSRQVTRNSSHLRLASFTHALSTLLQRTFTSPFVGSSTGVGHSGLLASSGCLIHSSDFAYSPGVVHSPSVASSSYFAHSTSIDSSTVVAHSRNVPLRCNSFTPLCSLLSRVIIHSRLLASSSHFAHSAASLSSSSTPSLDGSTSSLRFTAANRGLGPTSPTSDSA